MPYDTNDEGIMVTAYLGLGANLGDRLGAMCGARQALSELPGSQ